MKYFIDTLYPADRNMKRIIKGYDRGRFYWYDKDKDCWQIADKYFNPETRPDRFIEITKEEAFMELL